MDSDEMFAESDRFLADEWFDEVYPLIYSRVAQIEPDLLQECSEIGKNLKTYVFAVREFAKIHFADYMAQMPLSVEGESLDTEIRASRDDPIYNEAGMRINNPFLAQTNQIPAQVTVKTEHGSATFTQKEVIAMIRASGPMT